MEIIADILKITIPAAIVLYAMYITITTFIRNGLAEKKIESHRQNLQTVLPIRLQAYERMCLFLERINPNNIVMRLNGTTSSALEFQQVLMHELREEFNHNLSQQVYMSHDAWERVRGAQQEVMTLINQAAVNVKADDAPIELSKRIFEKIVQENRNPTTDALQFIKAEIQKEFM